MILTKQTKAVRFKKEKRRRRRRKEKERKEKFAIITRSRHNLFHQIVNSISSCLIFFLLDSILNILMFSHVSSADLNK